MVFLRFPGRATAARLAALTVALAWAGVAAAGNWPQWRGPNLDGSASDTGLPRRWTTTENVKWAVELPGPGSATPIVWGKRVFLSSVDSRDDSLVALCLDADSGSVLWSKTVGRNRSAPRNNMASPSAVTDGSVVCFTYGTGQLAAFDLAGEPLWRRDLVPEFGFNALMFGYSSSPLLLDGTLFLPAIRNSKPDRYSRQFPKGASRDPVKSYVLAVGLRDGKTRWRHARVTDAVGETQEAYTTPMPFRGAHGAQILVLGADYITAHRPATGEELWRWGGWNPTKITHWRIVTSPVSAEGLVYVCAPKHAPLYAIRPDKPGVLDQQHVAWTFPEQTPDASTPLLYDGRLYLLQDDRKVISCLDPATGTLRWQGKLGGAAVFRASLTAADGRIYAMNERAEVTVLAAGDKFEILHRTSMRGAKREEAARASIAIANNSLFIRTGTKLFCIAR